MYDKILENKEKLFSVAPMMDTADKPKKKSPGRWLAGAAVSVYHYQYYSASAYECHLAAASKRASLGLAASAKCWKWGLTIDAR